MILAKRLHKPKVTTAGSLESPAAVAPFGDVLEFRSTAEETKSVHGHFLLLETSPTVTTRRHRPAAVAAEVDFSVEKTTSVEEFDFLALSVTCTQLGY